MKREMDQVGLLLCDVQGKIFEQSVTSEECSSSIFIRRYMNSKFVSRMDNLTFINENIGFLSPSCEVVNPTWILLRTEDGGKTFEKVIFENQLIESITQESLGINHIQISVPYEQNGILYVRLQFGETVYKDRHYSLYKSKDNGKTWSFVKTVRYFSSDEDNNFNGGG